MEMDNLKELWYSEPAVAERPPEPKHVLSGKLRHCMRRLQRRFTADLLFSLVLAILFIAGAWWAGIRYWTDVALWMGTFSLILLFFYVSHRRLISYSPGMGDSLLDMTRRVERRIRRLVLAYRVFIPLMAAGWYTWFIYRYQLFSLLHLLWLLPLVIMLTEGVLRIMYGGMLRELKEVKEHITRTG